MTAETQPSGPSTRRRRGNHTSSSSSQRQQVRQLQQERKNRFLSFSIFVILVLLMVYSSTKPRTVMMVARQRDGTLVIATTDTAKLQKSEELITDLRSGKPGTANSAEKASLPRKPSSTVSSVGVVERVSTFKVDTKESPTEGTMSAFALQETPYCTKFQPITDSTPTTTSSQLLQSMEWNGTSLLTSNDIMDQLKQGDFPTTVFTPHVQSIVDHLDIEQMEATCKWKFTLEVPQPYTQPTYVICQGKLQQRMVPWWCTVLERLFLSSYDNNIDDEDNSASHGTWLGRSESGHAVIPILPTNVTFAISSKDFSPVSQNAYTCLANSAPNHGFFSIMNFLELQRMADQTTYNATIDTWHQRCTIPIWRGSAWIVGDGKFQERSTATTTLVDNESPNNHSTGTYGSILGQALQKCPRCRAVEFSKRHPELLDARIGDGGNGFLNVAWNKQYQRLWSQNSTNGLHELLPIHTIPSNEYYTHYQTALVLCGLGAAFRTAIHFSTTTAVVLQECPYQEWYHMISTTNKGSFEPWKHYIPLDAELATLESTLLWIQDHPREVQEIALAGRQFYQDYLSFQRNYEHIYELIYRLSLRKLKLQVDGT